MKKHLKNSRGSFSAVSTATITRNDTFCSIFRFFRDLQDLHSFAPLRSQNFQQKRIEIVWHFLRSVCEFFKFSKSLVYAALSLPLLSPNCTTRWECRQGLNPSEEEPTVPLAEARARARAPPSRARPLKHLCSLVVHDCLPKTAESSERT